MQSLHAFNFQQWIDANRAQLKPPVGNKRVFRDGDFIIMVVGGPNARKDFHVDPGQEFFYQLEGDMVLKTMQDGREVDVPIRAGEVLLIPPKMPHYEEFFELTDIEKQFPPVFERFFASLPKRTCGRCGTIMERS